MKQAFFINFEDLPLKQIKPTFLEDVSPTLNAYNYNYSIIFFYEREG